MGQYIAAPHASKFLADLGATVVKVERPERGDPMRSWDAGTVHAADRAPADGQVSGEMPQFRAYNAGKQSVVLDLKQPAHYDDLMALVAQSDVFIENFRPGVTERLGVDEATLRGRNAELIYCSITGFGRSGPYAHRPSYDNIISAMSGLYSHLIDFDLRAQMVGPAFSDLITGLTACIGVLAALHARPEHGGQRVDTTMLGSLLHFLSGPIESMRAGAPLDRPDHRIIQGGGHVCVAADGLPFVIHASTSDHFWGRAMAALGLGHLAEDPRFSRREDRVRNYDALDVLVKDAATARTRAEWLRVLDRVNVPFAPVNTIEEAVGDPQAVHLAAHQGPFPHGALAFSVSGARPAGPAPALGQHDATHRRSDRTVTVQDRG